jgi:hypothetical protein
MLFGHRLYAGTLARVMLIWIARQQQQPRTFKTYAGGQRIRAMARQQQQPRTFETCAGGQRIPQRGGHSATATATTYVQDVCRGSAHPVGRGHSATATATTHIQDVRRGSARPATNAAAYWKRACMNAAAYGERACIWWLMEKMG